jgi:hypothetical protein
MGIIVVGGVVIGNGGATLAFAFDELLFCLLVCI